MRISVLDSRAPRHSGASVPPGRQRISVPRWLPDSGDGETLHVARHVRGTAAVTHDGAEVLLNAGDIVFCEPGTLAFPSPGDGYRVTIFHVPRHLLDIEDADLRQVMGVPLRCADGAGALVSHFLSVLAEESEVHRSQTGDRLVANAVEILAVLVTDFLGTGRPDCPDPGTRMAVRIREYIELHLADLDLSPHSIARAHHISVRYLHKLFQGEGTTVSRLIRRRRLEACRRELGRSPGHGVTVAAVAHRWGFVSPSHFSRAFRDAYGMSPSQWQSTASSEPALPGRARPPVGDRSHAAGGQRLLSA